jgi:hypothetical protein
MTRIAHEFENLILAVRRATSEQKPLANHFLDRLIEKSRICFSKQKDNTTRNLWTDLIGGAAGIVTAGWTGKAEAAQWSQKATEVAKTYFSRSQFDTQMDERQIQHVTTEWTTFQQGQQQFLQNLDTVLQRNQQNEDAAKR